MVNSAVVKLVRSSGNYVFLTWGIRFIEDKLSQSFFSFTSGCIGMIRHFREFSCVGVGPKVSLPFVGEVTTSTVFLFFTSVRELRFRI
jgi:hypothetical protein